MVGRPSDHRSRDPEHPPMTRTEFEQVLQDVLEQIPEAFRYALENVAIVVEEEPDEPESDGELLGLYEGIPLPDRVVGHVGLPDRIRIFRGPILRMCGSDDGSNEQVAREIRDTLIHELGHHMGLEEDEMPY